jgi:carbon-monoxide dehydrogenase small subunit
VYLDGVVVCACLVAAGQAEGRDVRTVEGLHAGADLHPVQQAFLDAGAVQCGFCTPGLLVAAHDLLQRHPSPTDPEIREALAGNLCRCTGYEKILDAVHLAGDRMAGDRPADDVMAEQ